MAINRDKVLINRAASKFEGVGVDSEKSSVDVLDNEEFVVLRSSSDILAVFAANEWQVTMLEPEDWPDELLDEAELIEA